MSNCASIIVEKAILSPLSYYCTFVKNQLGLFEVGLFLDSLCVSLCPDHTVLTTITTAAFSTSIKSLPSAQENYKFLSSTAFEEKCSPSEGHWCYWGLSKFSSHSWTLTIKFPCCLPDNSGQGDGLKNAVTFESRDSKKEAMAGTNLWKMIQFKPTAEKAFLRSLIVWGQGLVF